MQFIVEVKVTYGPIDPTAVLFLLEQPQRIEVGPCCRQTSIIQALIIAPVGIHP
ncbi:hypothetical protein D3C73_1316930 [compost metagenome]